MKLIFNVRSSADSGHDAALIELSDSDIYEILKHGKTLRAMSGCSEIRFRDADITFFDQVALEGEDSRLIEVLEDDGDSWVIAPEDFVLPYKICEVEVRMACKELVVYSGECHWKVLEHNVDNEFDTHCIEFQALSALLPKKKLVYVELDALTRVEWSGYVEVPADGELDEDALLEKVYGSVDGSEYYPDEHFWKKGEQHVDHPGPIEGANEANSAVFILCEDGELIRRPE